MWEMRFTEISNSAYFCTDIIFGLEFMLKHKVAKMEFGGPSNWLELNKTQVICSLEPAVEEPPRLFSNFTKDCYHIAMKSRWYSHEDMQGLHLVGDKSF